MLGFLKRRRDEIENLRKEIAEIKNAAPLSSGIVGSSLYDVLTTSTSHAGQAVTEQTAMKVSAVYACVRLIAGAIASLPLPIYQRTADGRERADHALWWLLNEQPTPAMSAAVFWEYLVSSVLLSGDGFSLIKRASPMSPNIIGFEALHPSRVTVTQEDGRLVYLVWDGKKAKPYDQDDMLHFPGVGFDGTRSVSPIRYAAKQGIGLAMAAEEWSARFFSNGARPDIAIEIPGNLTEDQAKVMRQTWHDRYGGASNSHLPAVLTGGVKVHELTMNAEDAALIATRQFQIIDIARVYGVPPHMIGETEKSTSWGSGIEQMGIGFVQYTLRPHLTRMEQELNRKCFRTARHFAEFNVDGLMEGDSKAQAEYFAKALGGPGSQGWMSVNEVRRLKNMKPMDGYDKIPRAGAKSEAPNEPNAQAASG